MQKHPKTAIKIARGPGPAPMGKTFMGGAFTCFRGGPPAHEGSFPPREIRLKRLCVLWFLSCCCGIPPGAAWGRRWRGSPPAASASASPGRGRKSLSPGADGGGPQRPALRPAPLAAAPAAGLPHPLFRAEPRRRPVRRGHGAGPPGLRPLPPGHPHPLQPHGGQRRHLPPAAGGPPGRRPHRAGGHPPGPPPGMGPLPPPLPGRGAAAGGRGRRPGAGAVLTRRDFRAPATKSAKNCL